MDAGRRFGLTPGPSHFAALRKASAPQNERGDSRRSCEAILPLSFREAEATAAAERNERGLGGEAEPPPNFVRPPVAVFSRRTHWSLAENAIAQAVEAHRRSGRALLDLTETNPTNVGLPMPRELIESTLSSPQLFDYAPLPFGLPAAREAIARYHQGAIPPERVCLTSSTSEAYAWLFKLLCDPGDRVLVPSPGYPLFDYLAALEGVELAPYRSRSWDDWSIDFDHLESQLIDRTRAIILVSPNNPTGVLLHRGDLKRLLEWVFFNLYVGNNDSHAKNLAILYTAEQGARLAPFYDLMSTTMYAGLSKRFAFSIGGEFNNGDIKAAHIEAMAEQLGFKKKYVLGVAEDLTENSLASIESIGEERSLAVSHGPEKTMLSRLQQTIACSTKKLQKLWST